MSPEVLYSLGIAVVLGGWIMLVNWAQRDNKEANEVA